MTNLKSKKGFTLAEVLIAIAIIAILAAVAFIAVQNYLRSMTKLEYDEYAKEIFVAAQNHLSMAEHEGYLGSKDGFGTNDPAGTEQYYIVVINGTSSDGVLDLMLPSGAIDGTVASGSYIIHYDKEFALVMDVFYWSETATRYKHSYSDESDEYSDFMSKRGDKNALKSYGTDKSVIGYYGNVEAISKETWRTLTAPTLELINAERLYAKITNPNTDTTIRLIITGRTSGNSYVYDDISSVASSGENKTKIVILDDVTSDKHFASLFCSGETGLIPGEDIIVQAVAYGGTESLTVPAYSAKKSANSLFADGSSGTNAKISNIRHLENLAKEISNVNSIRTAEQTTDLDWNDFKTKIGTSFPGVTYYGGNPASSEFMPVNYTRIDTSYSLNYNGNSHTIKNVVVSGIDNSGLFGSVPDSSNIHDLKLLDFNITGTSTSTSTAGALAGTLTGSTVENVVAYHTSGNSTKGVTGTTAGGLIGSMVNGHLNFCAAALIVGNSSTTTTTTTTTTAGGLVGSASGTAEIAGCYSGGHTTNGAYTADYNVKATGTNGTAGGLVGSWASSGTISKSYSTCSVSGSTSGGFIGNKTGSGSVSNCYCTGLVDGAESSVGAFAGAYSGTVGDNCNYFSIINGSDVKAFPGSDNNVSPFDASTTAYQSFLDGAGTGSAKPYDASLTTYYKGKYSLKTVTQLGEAAASSKFVNTHYGDWPSPEIFFVNVKTGS